MTGHLRIVPDVIPDVVPDALATYPVLRLIHAATGHRAYQHPVTKVWHVADATGHVYADGLAEWQALRHIGISPHPSTQTPGGDPGAGPSGPDRRPGPDGHLARGVAWGLLLSAPMWIAAAITIRWVWL